jgi:hypothetical protein
MMHNATDMLKQFVMWRFADGVDGFGQIVRVDPAPASSNHHAAAPFGDSLF